MLAAVMYANTMGSDLMSALEATVQCGGSLQRSWSYEGEVGPWVPPPPPTIPPQDSPSPPVNYLLLSSVTWSWIILLFPIIFSLWRLGTTLLTTNKRRCEAVLVLQDPSKWLPNGGIDTARAETRFRAAVRLLFDERKRASAFRTATETATVNFLAVIARLEKETARTKSKLDATVRHLSEERTTNSTLRSHIERATTDSSVAIANLKKEGDDKVANVETRWTRILKETKAGLDARDSQITELQKLLSESRIENGALKRKNEERKEEVKVLRETGSVVEQKQAVEDDYLGKKLVDAEKKHTTEARPLQQKLAETVEAREASEAAASANADGVDQGITGSGYWPTEAQPAVEADKAEASGVAVSGGEEGPVQKGGEVEKRKKPHHR